MVIGWGGYVLLSIFPAQPIGLTGPVEMPGLDAYKHIIWHVGLLLGLSLMVWLFWSPSKQSWNPEVVFGKQALFGFFTWFISAVGLSLFTVRTCLFLGVKDYFWLVFASSMVFQGCLLIAAVLIYRMAGETASFHFVTDIPALLWDPLRGLAEYLRVFPLLAAVMFLNSWFILKLGLESNVPPSLRFLSQADVFPRYLAVTFILVFVAPICEELFFRGGLHHNFLEFLEPRLAAFGSSLIFASIHMEPQWFIPLWVLGYFLARSYEQSGSILTPIGFHAAQNGVSMALYYCMITQI